MRSPDSQVHSRSPEPLRPQASAPSAWARQRPVWLLVAPPAVLMGLRSVLELLIDDPQVAQRKPGDRLLLRLAQGRFDGLFVTGWQTVPTAPAGPAGSL